jgi:hypothetical protein
LKSKKYYKMNDNPIEVKINDYMKKIKA